MQPTLQVNAGKQCEAAKFLRRIEVHHTRAQRAQETSTLAGVRKEGASMGECLSSGVTHLNSKLKPVVDSHAVQRHVGVFVQFITSSLRDLQIKRVCLPATADMGVSENRGP